MKMDHGNTCKVCGKRKGGRDQIDHSECAKILKAKSSTKKFQHKTLSKENIDFLSKIK